MKKISKYKQNLSFNQNELYCLNKEEYNFYNVYMNRCENETYLAKTN